jgi:hypothetical protein
MVGFMSVLVSNNIYDQKNLEICFAIAIATLVRAAESHIYGRKIETHQELVEDLIKQYGT